LSGLSVTVATTGQAEFARLINQLEDLDPLKRVLARSAENQVVRFLRQLNLSRSGQDGLGTSGFYADAAAQTTGRATGDGFLVTISKLGFRLRFYGGTVVPINGEFLTIPAVAEAKGVRAGEFDNLYRFGGTLREQAGSKREPETDRIFYYLARKTEHDPDPSVVPSDSEFESHWREDMIDFLERRFGSNG